MSRLVLFLAALAGCAGVDPPRCPAWADLSAWQVAGNGGQVQRDACGRPTVFAVQAPADVQLTRALTGSHSLGALLTSDCRAGTLTIDRVPYLLTNSALYASGVSEGNAYVRLTLPQACTGALHIDLAEVRP
ncbi:MAG: hypothetical protein E6Q97_16955 [Desulfurellales bacterium]|nr:MAG: hypothetical protein E6Q97_16955 [Desulfurellales bacterium]